MKALSSGRLLPVIEIFLGDKKIRALVDTGCSTVVVRTNLVDHVEGRSRMYAFDNREVECRGVSWLDLVVAGTHVKVYAVVIDNIVDGVDVVLGMDAIDRLGGVLVTRFKVQFGDHFGDGHFFPVLAAAKTVPVLETCKKEGEELCNIEDKDFKAKFDGKNWTVEWVWKDQPPILKNKISCYDKQMSGRKKEEFEKEIERWIDEGIMLPWSGEVEGGILPLMAVEQPTKSKVRPVLDYRELNNYVECHTGDDMTDVCSETLREWRQVEGETTLVDLKSAYLQIRVSKELWKYQLVKYKDRMYCLTRLGFGLNSAPRIMSKILKTVLSKSKKIKAATSSYIDDILVNESQVTAKELIQHLSKFGLTTKPPEPLDGGAALGLKIERNKSGELMFTRGNELPVIPESLTRRELFSVCGKLVGHYPIAGWLRVACSFIKRKAEGTKWDDHVGEPTMSKIREVMERVKMEDPVKGRWTVPRRSAGRGVVWCDSSSIAMGVLLEIEDRGVEDAAWLRKKEDFNHINVAELESILKGVNLALKWGLKNISLMTDSATVYGWVNAALTELKRIRTKGAAEMIVKRRLGILRDLIDEFDLQVTITHVPTTKNRADELTRVKKTWLTDVERDPQEKVTVCAGAIDLQTVHNMHHVGVERTLFLARKIDPNVTRRSVQEVVSGCEMCQSIDPAPVYHSKGELGVKENWKRLAIDVTHYRQMLYLTIVDCGPGRFAIWKDLRYETAQLVTLILNEVFLERGPVEELLMDNSAVFRSEKMREFLERWQVRPYFRAAYRPSGNGIVERHHRTIKAMAERGGIAPTEAVFWYNMSPRSGQNANSVPQRSVFRYDWRHPAADPPLKEEEEVETINLGDEVWVKPPHARCTTQWRKGIVTGLNSKSNVSVDGMPRHILDIRRVVCLDDEEDRNDEDGDDDTAEADYQEVEERRYPLRDRRPPAWLRDYETGEDEE